jgi:hypothetical protein
MAAGLATAGVLAAPAATASGRTQIQVQDRCDPVTFDAALGAGSCVSTRDGTVTFAAFLARANPHDGGHGAWNFSRKDTHIDRGEALHVSNTGGEVHSFTEVSRFGTVGIAPLDAALPDGTPAALPIGDPATTFLPPGAVLDVAGLSPGVHTFQCLIHPWMRTTVEVRG